MKYPGLMCLGMKIMFQKP